MKNLKIVCIDITKYTNSLLLESLSIFGKNNSCVFDSKSILACKSKNFVKIYIDMLSGSIVAYTTVYDNEISYTTDLNKIVSSVDVFSVSVTKSEKMEDQLNEMINGSLSELSVDSILEKISRYGINTLTDVEKEFLDNSNI